MDVCEGTSFELPDGTWQRPDVTLDDSDLMKFLSEHGFLGEAFDKISLAVRYKLLSALARRMLLLRHVELMQRQAAVPDLKAKAVRWLQEEGMPQVKQVKEEIAGLIEKVNVAVNS